MVSLDATISLDKWEDPEVYVEVHYDNDFAYITLENPAEAIDLAIPIRHASRVAAALAMVSEMVGEPDELDCN